MLTEKIKANISAIENKSKIQKQKLSNEQFNTRLIAINRNGERLESVISILQAIKNNGIASSSPISVENKDALMEAINSCGQSIDDFSLDENIVARLKLQTDMIEQLVTAYWKQVAKDFSSGATNYLVILGNLTANPKQAEELIEKIRNAQNSAPSPKSIDIFVQNVHSAQTMVDQYKLSPDIQEFLLKVKLKTASIEDLTPEVIEWLKENKLMKKLLISF